MESIRLEGAAELRRQLLSLDKTIAKKVMRAALREGAEVVQEIAKAKAPRQTGELASSIKVRTATKLGRGKIGVTVVTGEGFFKGDQFYAGFVELGHFVGKRGLPNRQHVPPHPFLRPAFDESKEKAVAVVADALRAGIEAAIRG